MSLDKMNRGELIAYCIKANTYIARLQRELSLLRHDFELRGQIITELQTKEPKP